jgi:hypothetical protein
MAYMKTNWSGKEDSNLRPLPPEGASPAITRRFTVAQRRKWSAYDRVCSRLILAGSSSRGFGPCPSHPHPAEWIA